MVLQRKSGRVKARQGYRQEEEVHRGLRRLGRWVRTEEPGLSPRAKSGEQGESEEDRQAHLAPGNSKWGHRVWATSHNN